MKSLHLSLPEAIYTALRQEAAALKRFATVTARKVIEEWLRERQRISLRQRIAAYAAKHASTTADLDPALEAASLELWRPKNRRR